MGAPVLKGRDNDLEITHRARQAVDARDHQGLPAMDELEDSPEFGTPLEGGAVAGLRTDHGAPCRLEGGGLDVEILSCGRDPRVADVGR